MLKKAVKKKAKRIERQEVRKKEEDMKKALTQPGASKTSCNGFALSKLVYSLIKSTCPWKFSPIGTEGDEDNVQDVVDGTDLNGKACSTILKPTISERPSAAVPRSEQSRLDATAEEWAALWLETEAYIFTSFDGVEDDDIELELIPF